MSKPIRIIDTSFNLIAEIDDYESFIYGRAFYEVGTFQITINVNKLNALELQEDRIIFLADDPTKAGIILDATLSVDDSGRGGETLVVTGTTLQGLTQRRISIPPAGQSHQTYANTREETIMKGYVDANMVNPVDANRDIPNLVIATDQLRGDLIDDKTRYKYISQEMTRVGTRAELGWDITLDIPNTQYLFDVYKGLDRTAGQSVNDRALFSPDFDNIEVQQLNKITSNYFNYAYVAGQGSGAARTIQEVGTDAGFGRIELFVDARDISTTAELTTRGQQKLALLDVVNSFSAQILSNSNLVYESNYDLGDIVTIQNTKWGVTLDARITKVTEIYEPGRPQRLEAVFGNDVPDYIDTVSNRFSNVEVESTR